MGNFLLHNKLPPNQVAYSETTLHKYQTLKKKPYFNAQVWYSTVFAEFSWVILPLTHALLISAGLTQISEQLRVELDEEVSLTQPVISTWRVSSSSRQLSLIAW